MTVIPNTFLTPKRSPCLSAGAPLPWPGSPSVLSASVLTCSGDLTQVGEPTLSVTLTRTNEELCVK